MFMALRLHQWKWYGLTKAAEIHFSVISSLFNIHISFYTDQGKSDLWKTWKHIWMRNVTVGASFRWCFLPSGKTWKLIALSEALQCLRDHKFLVTCQTPKNICCTKRDGSRSGHLIPGIIKQESQLSELEEILAFTFLQQLWSWLVYTVKIAPQFPPKKLLWWTLYQHLMDIIDCGHLIKSKWSEPKFIPRTVFLKNQCKNMIYFKYKLIWNTLVIKWRITVILFVMCHLSEILSMGDRWRKWGCWGQELKTCRRDPHCSQDLRYSPRKRQR